jgi:hypothetical protein
VLRSRWLALFALLTLALVACSGDDPELSTDSTQLVGGTDPATPSDSPSTTTGAGGESGSPSTSLVGQTVAGYEVVQEIPNENGVTQLIVIPDGAYTDVDLENFVIDLIEGNPNLYGAEIFGDQAAVDAFLVPEAERTEEQNAALESDWYVTLTGRDRIDYRGPFSEFPGAAIGS